MAWYGESYQIDSTGIIAGPSFDAQDWYLHWDAAHHAVSAGDDVMVGAYADPDNFSEFADYADPIVARWAIEVVGGSGVLTVSAGVDPSFTYTNPALASQALGDFTVAGAATVVTGALTGVDHAMLAAQDSGVVLRIQCTSGSVDIAQVKLRVWPAAGVAGGWVSVGDASVESQQVQRRGFLRAPGTEVTDHFASSVTNYFDYPDPDGAQDAVMDAQPGAIAQLADAVGSTGDFVYSGPSTGPVAQAAAAGYSDLVIFPEDGYASYYRATATVNSRPGWVWADMRNITPDVPFFGIDPKEHRYESEAYFRPVGGGALVRTFGGWTTGAVSAAYGRVYSPGASDTWPVGPATVHQVTVGDTPSTSAPFVLVSGGATTVIPAGVSGVDSEVVQTVPLVGGERLLLSIDVPGLYAPATSADGLEDDDWFGHPTHKYEYDSVGQVDLVDAGHLVLFGPLEVWDPAAVAVQPRFYVKHQDDTMRPVGFGKPATELTVLRVPGGGRWRDLTTDEYATYGPTARPPGGMSLKVKRLDAGGTVWWDQVGWMVPDA